MENLIERLAILKGSGTVEVGDLPERYRRKIVMEADPARVEIPEAGVDFNSAVDAYENALIMRALEKTGWNRNQAALLLRLNRTTLVEKIKRKACVLRSCRNIMAKPWCFFTTSNGFQSQNRCFGSSARRTAHLARD